MATKTNWGANDTNDFFLKIMVQVAKTILNFPYLDNRFQHVAKKTFDKFGYVLLWHINRYGFGTGQSFLFSTVHPGDQKRSMCEEDTKELFWKYVPSRQKILKLPYLDNRFQHVPKIKRNPKKKPLVLIAKFQPTELTNLKKSTTLLGRHESVFSVFEKLFVQKKKAS